MYKGIEKGRRKCVASCTFIRIFFKSAHKGYLPTKWGKYRRNSGIRTKNDCRFLDFQQSFEDVRLLFFYVGHHFF